MGLTPVYNPNAYLGEAAAALRRGIERGIRCFHCAEHYAEGEALRMVGETLADAGLDDARVVAKIDVHAERMVNGPEGVESTCALLGRERLDVAQLTGWSPWANEQIPAARILDDLEAGGRIAETVGRLRDASRIGRVAIEVESPEDAERAAGLPEIDMVVCDQSILRQVVPPGLAGPEIREGRVEVLAIRPLAGGWLTDAYRSLEDFPESDNRREWYFLGEPRRTHIATVLEGTGIGMFEAAIRFLHQIAFPQHVAVGMRTVAQVEAATCPELSRPLPDDLYRELVDLFDQPVVLEE
jgi:aryl-alcohol dehydrogenase-like predicted oxidoreductase